MGDGDDAELATSGRTAQCWLVHARRLERGLRQTRSGRFAGPRRSAAQLVKRRGPRECALCAEASRFGLLKPACAARRRPTRIVVRIVASRLRIPRACCWPAAHAHALSCVVQSLRVISRRRLRLPSFDKRHVRTSSPQASSTRLRSQHVCRSLVAALVAQTAASVGMAQVDADRRRRCARCLRCLLRPCALRQGQGALCRRPDDAPCLYRVASLSPAGRAKPDTSQAGRRGPNGYGALHQLSRLCR